MLALRPDLVMTVAVAPPARWQQRRQQDDAGAQVVLDRVCEEGAAKEQSREGKHVRDGVPRVVDMRLREQLHGAANDCERHQDGASSEAKSRYEASHQERRPAPPTRSSEHLEGVR